MLAGRWWWQAPKAFTDNMGNDWVYCSGGCTVVKKTVTPGKKVPVTTSELADALAVVFRYADDSWQDSMSIMEAYGQARHGHARLMRIEQERKSVGTTLGDIARKQLEGAK